MAISRKIQTRVVMITLALMIAAVAVQAQSGSARVSGVVADESAGRQGKFVVVKGATVELHSLKGSSKLSATTDDKGVYSFRISYGDYTLSVLAPGYRPYTLRFFADSDAHVSIAVLLLKE